MKNLSLIAALTVGATGLSLAFAPSAHAILYNLGGVVFDGTDSAGNINGNITGSFNYVAGTNTYQNINIQVTGTGGDPNIGRYDALFSGSNFTVSSNSNASLLVLNIGNIGLPNNTNFRRLRMTFLTPLTSGLFESVDVNGQFLLRGTGTAFSSNQVSISNAGTVKSVPLDANSIPVVVSGLFLAGGIFLKKKRDQAKVADFVTNNKVPALE